MVRKFKRYYAVCHSLMGMYPVLSSRLCYKKRAFVFIAPIISIYYEKIVGLIIRSGQNSVGTLKGAYFQMIFCYTVLI